jgi:hypothetical protein
MWGKNSLHAAPNATGPGTAAKAAKMDSGRQQARRGRQLIAALSPRFHPIIRLDRDLESGIAMTRPKFSAAGSGSADVDRRDAFDRSPTCGQDGPWALWNDAAPSTGRRLGWGARYAVSDMNFMDLGFLSIK